MARRNRFFSTVIFFSFNSCNQNELASKSCTRSKSLKSSTRTVAKKVLIFGHILEKLADFAGFKFHCFFKLKCYPCYHIDRNAESAVENQTWFYISCALQYNTSQKHKSTILLTYVMNKYLTACSLR